MGFITLFAYALSVHFKIEIGDAALTMKISGGNNDYLYDYLQMMTRKRHQIQI